MEKIATQLGVYQDISHASYTLRAARLFRCVCVCGACQCSDLQTSFGRRSNRQHFMEIRSAYEALLAYFDEPG